MGSWDKNFSEHALWAKLTTLKTRVIEAEPPGAEDEATERDTVHYALAVVEMAAARRNHTPSLLVTGPMLQASADAVDNVTSYLQEWQSGQYTCRQVVSTVEGLVATFAAWPPMAPDATADAHIAATRRLNDVTDGVISAVEERRSTLVADVTALQEQAQAITADVAAQRELLDAEITTFQTGSGAALEEQETNWTSARKAQAAEGDEALAELQALEAEARQLVNAAASSVVATDYGRYARNKTIAAWICDIAAAVIGAAGIGAILLHLYREGVAVDGNVGLSLTRLGASLGTLGIAALVAHRGHDHHKEARAAKRTDLAVRQVGPFIANLPPDVRERVVVELTDRIFIRGELDEGPERSVETSLWDRIVAARREASDEAASTT